jgi:predicted phage terminase large subunit-like protein
MTPAEERYLLALKRRRAALNARDDMISFAQVMMPDPMNYEDSDFSAYQAARHHRAIAAALEQVESGKIKRLIINLGPRHGKSQLTSRLFPAWYLGRHPNRSLILGTYNEKFSWDFGRDVRSIMQDPIFAQVFPDARLQPGAASVDRLETTDGGKLFLVGRGGSVTGRGGNLILDDPIKDRVEADSPTTRDKLWQWYNQVLKTRLLSQDGWIVIIQTRWHEDDLVGRLTDPMNPHYSAVEAQKWRIIDLPALARDGDVLGRKEGEALWPERFPASYLHELRESDPRGFQALYQGSPTPDKGNFFPAERIKTYNQPHERPANEKLRFYAASDHAVSTKQNADKSCLMVVGVDEDDNLWVMDELVWGRFPTDTIVERMIDMMAKWKPMYWWAERGHISKSIGPFLRKRMLERSTFTAVDEITPVNDKQTRAQSIQGRMAMGKVYLPSYAPWYAEARDQLLKFPFGAHDDFCDTIAYIGLGLAKQVGANRTPKAKQGPKVGTLGWIKSQTRDQERARMARNGGW